jgi:SulP family sulfate permease
MTWLRTLLPAFDWARSYDRSVFAGDLTAAVIVTIMLIPQSLAYALLAGLPPQVGLYASILPLIAYAVFGTSRTLAVGPVAVVSLMTASAIAPIASADSAAYVSAALILALMSGVILVLMATLRLGVMANFLSHPVIAGFISASGILIAISQAKHILGIAAKGDTLPDILQSLAGTIGTVNLPTLVIGVAALAFLFWVRKSLKPLLTGWGLGPRLADMLAKAGPVAAVITSAACVSLLDLDVRGVKVVGTFPSGLPPVTLPSFDPALWSQLLPAAILISLVGFVESVSVAQTLAAKRRQRIGLNRELVGLGAANLAAALTGGYPVTGGFARSVVNFDAGAQTPFAGVLTAVGILATAMFFTPLFETLPQAVLGATIIVAVLSLVDLHGFVRTWRYSKADGAAMHVTALVVLLIGVEPGIVSGVVLSLLLFLWRTSRPHMAIVGQVPGTEHFRNVLRHKVAESPRVLSIRVDESLYFANARYLEDRIYDYVASREGIRHVVLMCPAVNFIDASALESLEAIAHRLNSAGVEFHLSEVKGPVMDRLKRSDFFDHFKGQVFLSQHQALAALDPDITRRADLYLVEQTAPIADEGAPRKTVAQA